MKWRDEWPDFDEEEDEEDGVVIADDDDYGEALIVSILTLVETCGNPVVDALYDHLNKHQDELDNKETNHERE